MNPPTSKIVALVKFGQLLRFSIILLSFLCFGTLVAQEPSAIHLTEKDGLPDIEFYDMLPDRQGFIWLAADKGLFRYDGKTFKNYSNPEKRGLSVFNLVEDPKGRIWCKNISGQIFYIENDELITFMDLELSLLGEAFNINILNNQLYLFLRDKALIVDIETKDILEVEFDKHDVIGNGFVFKGAVYNIYNDQLLEFHPDGTANSLFSVEELAIPDLQYRFFLFQNQLFMLTKVDGRNHLYMVDTRAPSMKEIELPSELWSPTLVRFVGEGNTLWVATSSGAFQYAFSQEKFIFKNHFLKDKFVTKFLIDRNGNSWFTTLDDGIYVLPNIHVKRYELPEELNHISALNKVSEDEFIFGTFSGRAGRYRIMDQEYDLFPRDFGRVSGVFYHRDLETNFISPDGARKGYGISDAGEDEMNFLVNVKDFAIVEETSFMVAQSGKAIIVDEAKKGTSSHMELLDSKRSYSCYYDRQKKDYYVSYADALVRHDSLLNSHPILHNNRSIFALDITQTEDGIIWVTTFNNGILGIVNDEVFAVYNTENGLVSNQTSKIQNEGNFLWVATDYGIQRIDTETETVRTLTRQDGIPSYKISGIAVLKDRIVFGSNLGIFEVDRKRAFRQRPPPKVYFKSITIAKEAREIQEDYHLTYDQNNIRFDFHANGFNTNENIVYEYRLLGGNESWTSLEMGVDFAEFGSLSNGQYTFEVRAKNAFAEQVSKVQRVSFSIASPFWERWWFVVGCISLLLLFVILYFNKLQKRKERDKNLEVNQLQLENQLTSLKLENLRSQMNPHFIFNALNSIQEYIVLNQKQLASDYLGKFADLVRTYLKHSGKGTITLQEEIDCLEMYLELEQMRFEDKLKYSISKSQDLFPEEIQIPTMLIQPYVENSLKHGLLHKKDNCLLTVSFKFADDFRNIICEVEDNGIGRERAMEYLKKRKKNHESFATKANDDRLELLNYEKKKKIGVVIEDLYDTEENPSGTKVTITIPCTKE
ncbi:histidine kinase [Aureisphaera galaxeae]|uniref:sensor histidine kinase n=1 Tax=Aureisphaera galaxeae TaxID=1538023 RepID=UPI0023507538|nr:histidine kinase [Aureisphaera galaxeae]MDC8005184.1 histidine kinase [Aureisphaera galaxeae]